MARTHARILTKIWSDPDFRSLAAVDQRLYVLAISQPNITFCGLVPFTAKRWSTFADDTTPAEIRASAGRLQDRRYVFVDEDTEELLVRNFPKHDGVLKSPNLVTAMSREYGNILSPALRDAFLQGLPERFLEDCETLKEGLAEGLAEGFLEGFRRVARCRIASPAAVSDAGVGNPQVRTHPEGLQEPFQEPLAERLPPARARAHGAEPLSPSPSPSPSPTPGRSRLTLLVNSRPPLVGAIETETEKQRTEQLAARAIELLGAAARPDDVVDLLWWALAYADWTIVDEVIGYCSKLEKPPEKVTYLAKTIRSWAAQRDVDMPEFKPTRKAS